MHLLLLNHKPSSLPSSPAQISIFQPLQTTVPLQHKQKPGLGSHCFALLLKSRAQIRCSQTASAASPLSCLLLQEANQGNEPWRAAQSSQLFQLPFTAQTTISKQKGGAISPASAGPPSSDPSSVLFPEGGHSGTTGGWKRHPLEINSAESSNMRMSHFQGVWSNSQNKQKTQGMMMI